ncbi:NAD(P)-binding protein [Halobacillus seohaensis]|uniref:precorrin-2 dehydrogenase n=1 Tax=Halobacillus seohaensis TaxID=447421 RepID=A0ABW2EJV0_9BACI
MTSIPLMIDLKNKKTVVIGGGTLAERRIRTLLEGEASIHVISPEIRSTLYSFFKQGLLQWSEKKFVPGDLKDAALIIVATNDSEINQSVVQHAPAHAWINAVERASDGDVHFPSYFKRGRLSISVSTGGASPTLASKIKKQLEEQYDDSYEAYLDFLFEARTLLKESSLSHEKKKTLLKQLVIEDFMDTEKQKEMLDWLNKY